MIADEYGPSSWPPQIVQFDEQKAKAALKTCPKIVRDYFRLIQQQADNWKDIAHKAIKKLRNNGIPQS